MAPEWKANSVEEHLLAFVKLQQESGDDRYACSKCQCRILLQKPFLMKHLKVHGTTEWKCRICNAEMRFLSRRLRHLKQRHPEIYTASAGTDTEKLITMFEVKQTPRHHYPSAHDTIFIFDHETH